MSPEEEDPLVGTTIDGRYVLRRRIGRGGMGVVYEAEHVGLGRRVAIKLLAMKQAPEAYLARFRREAKLASRITHEHLVHIHDVGIDAATATDYIAMELVLGRDLGRELGGGPLGFARIITITRQLLHALHAVHEGGIIHRDIKPGNVMLAPRGGERDFVKLMDFGVARGLGDATLTATGHVVGTPSFMSPEQVRGQEIDRRSDIYAVGITLFAMIAGRLPFEGNTAVVVGQHVFQPPPMLAQIRPGTPPALVAAVERALAKDPADRFPDALAFAAALEGRAPEIVETASPATVVDRPAPRRARTGLVVGLSLAVAALGAGLWLATSGRGTSGEAPIASAYPPPAPPQTTPTTPTAPTAPGAPTTPSAPTTPIDAAVVPPADADVADGEAPTRPPPGGRRAAPADEASARRCHCIPTDAPDIIGLCATKGPSLCRCDSASGASLCPTPVEIMRQCPPGSGARCVTGMWGCGDSAFASFARAGRVDEPCSGYLVPRVEGDPDRTLITGHLECDVCSGTKLDSYVGRAGDACTGFYWRTGETKSGKLAHCQ